MIDLKQLATSLANLTLKEVQELQAILYKDSGIEISLDTNTWKVCKRIDKEQGLDA